MIRKWNVDDSTEIEARSGFFGKTVLAVNGQPLQGELTTRKKNQLEFRLPDGRHASMAIKPRIGTTPEFSLSVGGQLMIETSKQAIKCDACGVIVKPNDRFCGSCGHELPSAETYTHRDNVKKATGAIKLLAVLFVVSGLLMFYLSHRQAETALTNLAGMDAAAQYPKPFGGHTYTVGELRKQIVWESRSILIVNFILAAVMAGLAVWGRRSPLPAILVATATYVVVIATNALLSPATIGQGIYLKIIVIVLLARGIKAALALRSADA
jgi:hypothetical protein